MSAPLHDSSSPPPVIIVGGGPVGIETAVALRQVGIASQIIEAGPIGHTISWWAPQTRWFSSNDRIAIAGVPLLTIDQSKATREEYLNYLSTVVRMNQLSLRTFTKVTRIDETKLGGGRSFRVHVTGAQPNVLDASAIVLAIGGTDFPNQLDIPGQSLPHVDGYLREVHRYQGRRVLIIGGRNSAVEAAIRLHRGGAEVALSYRNSELPLDNIKYWLRPEMMGLIASGAIQTHFNTQPIEITPSEVVLADSKDLSRVVDRVAAQDVLALIGYRQDASLLKQLGIECSEDAGRPFFDPETMQTNREGIYIAGTAIGGTQSSKYQVYLENCHDHSAKIAEHLSQSMHRRSLAASVPPQCDALQRRIELQPES